MSLGNHNPSEILFKYIYDDITKEFIETKEVEIDEYGDEVKYACETYVEPPVCKQYEKQIYDPLSHQWTIVEDHRDREVFLDGVTWKKWKDLGPLPDKTTFQQVTGPRTLDRAKKLMCDNVNTYRDKTLENGLLYNGVIFDSDSKSISVLSEYRTQAQEALSLNIVFEEVAWTLKDNTEYMMSGFDFMELMKAYTAYNTILHNYAASMKSDIRAIGIEINQGSTDEEREQAAIDRVMSYVVDYTSVAAPGCAVTEESLRKEGV